MSTSLITSLYAVAVTVCIVLVLVRAKSRPLASWYHFVLLLFYGTAFFLYWGSDGNSIVQFRCAGTLLLSLFTTMVITMVFPRQNRSQALLDQPSGERVLSKNVYLFSSLCVVVITLSGLLFGGQLHRLKEGYTMTSRDRDAGYYYSLRSDAHLLGGGNISVRLLNYVSRHGIGPFIAILAVALWRSKRTRQAALIAGLLCICIFLAKASTLKKMDAIFFVMQCALVCTILSTRDERENTLKAIKIAGVGALGLCGVGTMYLVFTNANNIAQIGNNLRIRIFEVPNYCFELFMTWYPDKLPFQQGLNVRILHNLFSRGGEYYPAHSLISEEAGTANAIYIADAWVDWGWSGVLITSLIVAFILVWVEKTYMVRNSAVNIAVLVFLIDPVKALISVSFITCAGGFGLVSVPLFVHYILCHKSTGARSSRLTVNNRLHSSDMAA